MLRQPNAWTPCLHAAVWLALASLFAALSCQAAERDVYKADGVVFSISVRTPEQIRAFYTARGFPEAAIRELESKCLLTVGVQNGRNDIVWLEPSKWRFFAEHGKPVTRISRETWEARWAKLNIPLASRATFGWTQLPETRDLLPGETAGGNIVITPPAGSFGVEARFDTGRDRAGPPLTFKVNNLKCVEQSRDKE